MKISKGSAFVIGVVTLFAAFVMVYVKAPSVSDIPVTAFLWAFSGLLSGYIGFNVLNNGVRGKTFNAELWDRENGKEETK